MSHVMNRARSLSALLAALVLLAPATSRGLPRVVSGRMAIPRGLAAATGPLTVTCPAPLSVRPTQQVQLAYTFSNIPPAATTLFWEWSYQRDWPVLDAWQVGSLPDGSLSIVYLVEVPDTVSAGTDSLQVTAWTDLDPGARTGCAHVITIPAPRFAPYVACARDTGAGPGTLLQLDFAVTNALPSAQTVSWSLADERGWLQPPAGGSVSLGADASAAVPVSIPVPDTLTPGVNRLSFRAWIPGDHPDADSCVTKLVWASTAVGPGAAGAAFALAGARPNPSRGELAVEFSLAAPGPARLEVFDTAGRRVRSREMGSLPAGPCRVDLGGGLLPAGVYLVRLTQGGRALNARAVVVR